MSMSDQNLDIGISQPSSASSESLTWSAALHRYNAAFVILFLFRYIRVVANIVASTFYRPCPIRTQDLCDPSDITVVIATLNLATDKFRTCVRSILEHPVASIVVCAGGDLAKSQISLFKNEFPDTRITVLHREVANRREQTALAMSHIKTSFLVVSDDHTYWPATSSFLPSLLAPFSNPRIGAVGPVLQARHYHYPILSSRGFWNFMGMAYLTRRSHEFLATNTIDGGLSCLSGRFAVFRSSIYTDPEFLHAYLNEYIFWGLVGPLNADEDKFNTRWLAKHGWDIKIQYTNDCVMETTLGEWPRFGRQCLRWTRTSWRSNPRTLVTGLTSCRRFPYTTYAILLYSFVRFSLFYEIALFYTLYHCLLELNKQEWTERAFWILALWIVIMKFLKLAEHFRRFPRDVVYFPAYLMFGYCSSLLRVWALLTCWNTSWVTESDTENASLAADKNQSMGEKSLESRGECESSSSLQQFSRRKPTHRSISTGKHD